MKKKICCFILMIIVALILTGISTKSLAVESETHVHTMGRILCEPECARTGRAQCTECLEFYDLPATGHTYSSTSRRCTKCNSGFNENYHFNNNLANSAEITIDMIENLKLKNYLYPSYSNSKNEQWVKNIANDIKTDYDSKSGKYNHYGKNYSTYTGYQKQLFWQIVNEYVNRNLVYSYGTACSGLDAYQVLNLVGQDTDGDGIVDCHAVNCEGYTVASRDIAWALGIESYYVSNGPHSLLLVKLDNEWFVADVTQGLLLLGPEEYTKYSTNEVLFIATPHISTGSNTIFPVAGYDVKTKKFYQTDFTNNGKFTRTNTLAVTGWGNETYQRNRSGNVELTKTYRYCGSFLYGYHTIDKKQYFFDNSGSAILKVYEAPKLDLKNEYTINSQNYNIKIPILNWSTYTEPIEKDRRSSISTDGKYVIFNAEDFLSYSGDKFTACICSDLTNRSLFEINIVVDRTPQHTHTIVSSNNAVSATCATDGKKSDTKCRTCGKTISTGAVIKATGHNYQIVKATTSKNGYEKCSKCGHVKRYIYYPKTVSLSSTKYTYNQKVQAPTVTVTDAKGKVIPASNYTVSYESGRKNVGTYKVTVTFKGNYTGKVTNTFDIVPITVKNLATVSQTTNRISVNWSKVNDATGYALYMSTSKNGTYTRIATIKNKSVTQYNVNNLKTGKTYYFKIRAYKTVNNKNYYGNCSAVLITTTKTKAPAIAGLSTGSKSVKIKWNKVNEATGYVIYMSTSKNGTYSKIATITSNNTLTYTKKGLTAKKNYYFKIRAYRKVNGKYVYSSLSDVKYIKVK